MTVLDEGNKPTQNRETLDRNYASVPANVCTQLSDAGLNTCCHLVNAFSMRRFCQISLSCFLLLLLPEDMHPAPHLRLYNTPHS